MQGGTTTIGNRWAILPMEGWDCMAGRDTEAKFPAAAGSISLPAARSFFTAPRLRRSCTPGGAIRASFSLPITPPMPWLRSVRR
ncbi:MAG: hypothetical protein V8T87_10545 [Victivallales bacterium]